MNLVKRFLSVRRDKLLMKLGCWLVCFSLVLGLILPEQKAEAVVAELAMASVAGVAVAYMCACGLPLVAQGMDMDGLISSAQRLIQEYLDTELGGITIRDWLGNVWDVVAVAGKIVMGRPITEEFTNFAQWVAEKYATQAGENVVYSDYTVPLADGGTFYLSWYKANPNDNTIGTVVAPDDLPILFASGYYLEYVDDEIFTLFSPSGSSLMRLKSSPAYVCIGFDYSKNVICFMNRSGTPLSWLSVVHTEAFLAGSSLVDLSVNRDEELVYIPPEITVDQGIALDVGAVETMDLDLVLQGVLDDVLAGELISTMKVAEEGTEDPPAEEEITDVDNLGLPALGAALTSRFPFSIPWDFFRAVKLLEAPAKTPYFEVDFMEPLADDVGGWNGSTTVVLDFSEYAIIGQISRWTSTIGFCLMLVGATKRLIWTA